MLGIPSRCFLTLGQEDRAAAHMLAARRDVHLLRPPVQGRAFGVFALLVFTQLLRHRSLQCVLRNALVPCP